MLKCCDRQSLFNAKQSFLSQDELKGLIETELLLNISQGK